MERVDEEDEEHDEEDTNNTLTNKRRLSTGKEAPVAT